MFTSDFADCASVFAGHLEKSEWADGERLAHTLKGLAATLGATTMAPLAGALETACKARQAEAAAAALAALRPQLTPLLAALHQYFAETTANNPTPASAAAGPAQLPDCLPRLRQLLGEGDSDAIDLWGKHQQEFARALSPQVAQRIGTALQNFEFDSALSLLAELPATTPTA